MTDHMTELIDLYLDGETKPSQTSEVEQHLKICEDCSKAVAQRRRLSKLIQAHPRIINTKSDRQFAREVMSRISRQPVEQTIKTAGLEPGWIGIPLLLVLGLAFIQAVWVETSVMRFIPQVGEVLDPSQYLLPFSFAMPTFLGQIIQLLPRLTMWSWSLSSAVILSAVLGVLYVSWLAGWWVKVQIHVHA
jgi:predicted anti-sigma-YlaC factor YlaD